MLKELFSFIMMVRLKLLRTKSYVKYYFYISLKLI